MSYIDGYFDRGSDIIRVVERQNGERVFKEYPIKYTFYYEDPRGKYKSTTGKTLNRVISKTTKDFHKELAINRNKQLFVRYLLKNYNLTGKKFEPLWKDLKKFRE